VNVFLVTVDVSGDHLGAALMRALKELGGDTVHISGVGGPEMTREGLTSLFPIDDFAIMGLASLPRRFVPMLKRMFETVRTVVAEQPDVLVIIDCPDFSHRVATRVRRARPDIPIVNYVLPQVWAWRQGRAHRMRRYIDHVLAVLPFEPKVLQDLRGPACTYVGHPLTGEVDDLRPNAVEQSRRESDPPLLLILPGSRSSEIETLFGTFRQTVDLVRERFGPIEVVIPTRPFLAGRIAQAVAGWDIAPRIVTEQVDKRAAFRSARAALAKSGTVTLELALSGIPMVAAYKVSAVEWAIGRRVVRVPSVILANLVIGQNVIPEFLQHDCTPEKLAGALLPLLTDTPVRRQQVEAFQRLDGIMGIGMVQPAARAAETILSIVKARRNLAGGKRANNAGV
jgi:lipid-A-disaccharide synthase